MKAIRAILWFQIACVLLNFTLLVIGPSQTGVITTAITVAALGFTRFVTYPRQVKLAELRATREREDRWWTTQLNIRSLELEHGIPLSELTVPHKVRGRK